MAFREADLAYFTDPIAFPMLRLFTLLLLLTTATLTAQALYNVRIGTFQDVGADDFAELRDLGFVYGIPMDGQLTDVYIGNYTTEARAQQVTDQLQGQGFRNAAPFALPVAGTEEAVYIQIALRARERKLDWSELEKAGNLFVEAADGVTKVVAGPYPDAVAANEALVRIRDIGFADAFIRTIKTGNLIPVGLFETGIKKPLIPFELVDAPEEPAIVLDKTVPAPPPPAPTESATDSVMVGEPMGEQAILTEAVVPVPVSRPSLPDIGVSTKRHSAAELQRVLKEKGFYEGSIDGYYGPGTAASLCQCLEPVRRADKLSPPGRHRSTIRNYRKPNDVAGDARDVRDRQRHGGRACQSRSGNRTSAANGRSCSTQRPNYRRLPPRRPETGKRRSGATSTTGPPKIRSTPGC